MGCYHARSGQIQFSISMAPSRRPPGFLLPPSSSWRLTATDTRQPEALRDRSGYDTTFPRPLPLSSFFYPSSFLHSFVLSFRSLSFLYLKVSFSSFVPSLVPLLLSFFPSSSLVSSFLVSSYIHSFAPPCSALPSRFLIHLIALTRSLVGLFPSLPSFIPSFIIFSSPHVRSHFGPSPFLLVSSMLVSIALSFIPPLVPSLSRRPSFDRSSAALTVVFLSSFLAFLLSSSPFPIPFAPLCLRFFVSSFLLQLLPFLPIHL